MVIHYFEGAKVRFFWRFVYTLDKKKF